MTPYNFATLVHLVGFLIGAALYGTLLALVASRRAPLAEDRLPLFTAILGLTWNVGGLAAYGIHDLAGREPDPLLIAAAFSALGFLPAVVVHSVLRGQSRGRFVIGIAYAISTIAETMLFWSAIRGEAASPSAMQLLTWSYAVLTIPVLVLTRRTEGSALGWSIVALAVFAVSALHLSHHEGPGSDTSLLELAGHHASIPLVFAILYQDFRFALGDLFLKRALAVFALVAVAAGLYLGVVVPVFEKHDFRDDPIAVGTVLILWGGTAFLYPRLQRGATWIVDRLVLHRPDYVQLRESIAARVAAASEPELVLDAVCDSLRRPLSAEAIRWTAEPAGAALAIPTAEPPRYAIEVGPLSGGRHLLSDDMAMLHDVALVAGRRIDAIRLGRERYAQGLREQEISKLATEAELRALRAQINPHFLFNALNTIGYLVQTKPEAAQATLMKLTMLLRGVLRSSSGLITLGEEIDLLSTYLDIEKARFEERLQVMIDVPEELRAIKLPPLLLQPLVENSLKHGIAHSRTGGAVCVRARSEGGMLVLTVENTGDVASDFEIARGRRTGVGLRNIEERLRLLFGSQASFDIRSQPDVGTHAEIRVRCA